MPKHVPTFKHLLTSSSSSHKPEKQERSVNELLASSRASASGSRDAPPHSPVTSSSVGVRWHAALPRFSSDMGQAGIVPCGELPVHPAEALRRAEVARRQASRTTAGPVPPPSWRGSNGTPLKAELAPISSAENQRQAIDRRELLDAEMLFDTSQRPILPSSAPGPARLVEHCLQAVLNHLESDEPVHLYSAPSTAGEEPPDTLPGVSITTVGGAMREQVGYLDTHLKIALLSVASILPEGSPARPTDRSYRAILSRPADSGDDDSSLLVAPVAAKGEVEGDREKNSDDWSDTSDSIPEIHHLTMTLHANPLPILRQLPSFPSVSLTSLNLAYSSIRNLEKLIAELPVSLRELGLAGIRLGCDGRKNVGADEDVWRRGLGMLGSRMIVLKMLDLSYPSTPISIPALTALLLPAMSKLPSLRILGMRNHIGSANAQSQEGRGPDQDLLHSVNRSGRKKWVDVVW